MLRMGHVGRTLRPCLQREEQAEEAEEQQPRRVAWRMVPPNDEPGVEEMVKVHQP
jgi:uncharacterized iron-regulated membrane protein